MRYQGIAGRETFGFGIWKSVYLVPVRPGGAAITQFMPHTFYQGGHPTSILTDTTHQGFEIRCKVQLWAPAATTGSVTVSVAGLPLATASVKAVLQAGSNTVAVTIPGAATKLVRLWHPTGNGAQARYNVSAVFQPAAPQPHGTRVASADAHTAAPAASGGAEAVPASTWRLLGFRHVALVTINDTDPLAAASVS